MRVQRRCRRLQQQPRAGQQLSPVAQQGQVQQYQTHVFAPVVTGAPMKNPKYPVGGVCVLCLGVPDEKQEQVSSFLPLSRCSILRGFSLGSRFACPFWPLEPLPLIPLFSSVLHLSPFSAPIPPMG